MRTTSDTKRGNTAKISVITNTCEKTNLDGIEPISPILSVTLPKPPSINHIYGYTCQKGFARSYITQEGRLWFEEAGYILKTKVRLKSLVVTPCAIDITFYTSRISTSDGDNILKPLLDLFQKQEIIKNDSLFYDIRVRKVAVGKEDQCVRVVISSVDIANHQKKELPNVSLENV